MAVILYVADPSDCSYFQLENLRVFVLLKSTDNAISSYSSIDKENRINGLIHDVTSIVQGQTS